MNTRDCQSYLNKHTGVKVHKSLQDWILILLKRFWSFSSLCVAYNNVITEFCFVPSLPRHPHYSAKAHKTHQFGY